MIPIKPTASSCAASDFASSQALGKQLAQRLVASLEMNRRAMHEFPVGKVLFKSGDRITQLPYLTRGRLDVVVHVPASLDRQFTPISFQAGELAFLSSLFNHIPIGGNLVVRDAAVVQWMKLAEVEEALLRDSKSLVLLVQFLGVRLREVQARERALSARDVKSRVGAGLLRCAADPALRKDGRVLVALTHEQLASRCGVSRPKTSVALKHFEDQGLLRLGRKWIELLDIAALQRHIV